MNYDVGLEVSLEQTAVCVLDEENWINVERSVASHADNIGDSLAGLAGTIKHVGFEAGPLAPWLYGGLAERDLPVLH